MRTLFLPIPIIILLLITVSCAKAQTWQWAKTEVIGPNNIKGLYNQTTVDSRGNIIAKSYNNGRIILTKHDQFGNLVWSTGIESPNPQGGNNPDIVYAMRGLTVDGADNIYFISRPLTKIGAETVSTPGPYAVVKLNPQARLVWAKQLNATIPFVFLANIIGSGDRLFLSVQFEMFTTLSYDNHDFINNAGANQSNFIASIDTTGRLIWGKRVFSSSTGPQCYNASAWPDISVNNRKDFLLTGTAYEKLYLESSAAVTVNKCQKFYYGLLFDGNNGNVKWVKSLAVDSLPARPNHLNLGDYHFTSSILSNGYAVMARYGYNDTIISASLHYTKELLSKLYLFNQNGDLVRSTTLGNLTDGWHEVFKVKGSETNNFFTQSTYHGFSPGRTVGTKKLQIDKWDTLFATQWSKQLDYSYYFPVMLANDFYYGNNVMSMIIGIGTEGGNGEYVHFGSDSLYPYDKIILARMVDSSNMMAGRVFIDFDKDGVKDSNEPPAQGVIIGTSPDTPYITTDQNGRFELTTGLGVYKLKPLNIQATYPYFSKLVPTERTITATSYGNYSMGNDFALQATTNISDGDIQFTCYSFPRPGFPLQGKIEILNRGTTTISGQYKVLFDSAKVKFLNSATTPDLIRAGEITFSVKNLKPLTTTVNEIELVIDARTPLSDTLTLIGRLDVANEADKLNNADTVTLVTRGSFDPNDKQVYPLRDVNLNAVLDRKQDLDYLIRFQNTGTDTAFTVIITDTLSSKLDITTFRLISSSHPVIAQWKSAHTLQFYFNNIMLPDSNVNEKLSHGYIRFKIKPLATVLLTDTVYNEAFIYFDYNDAVKTNKTVSNFSNKVAVVTGITDIIQSARFLKIQPNPVYEKLTFTITDNNVNENMKVSIYDMQGRLKLYTSKKVLTNQPLHIPVQALAKGDYILKVMGRKHTYIKKLVKL